MIYYILILVIILSFIYVSADCVYLYKCDREIKQKIFKIKKDTNKMKRDVYNIIKQGDDLD